LRTTVLVAIGRLVNVITLTPHVWTVCDLFIARHARFFLAWHAEV
jgi:hypothetical protein